MVTDKLKSDETAPRSSRSPGDLDYVSRAAMGEKAIMGKFTKWWSDDEERRLRRKLDVRIIVISFALYFVALLDRGNIGNAKTAGMNRDLGISDQQYQWLLTIFYIAYIVFQFLLLGYKVFSPPKWIAGCVFVWGVAGVCQAAVQSWSGLMACRFILGVAEAGYGTGVALYFSFFYPRDEIGLRFGTFVSAGAVSSAVAGAIAYGLVHAHATIESWRLLFLIEGIPTLLMVPIVLVVLPRDVQSCRFLSAREREIAEARLFRPPPPPRRSKTEDGGRWTLKARFVDFINWGNAGAAFLDPLSYLISVMFFIINVCYSSVPVYLPTLIEEMGYSSINAQGLSAPPYVLAFLLAILFCWISDRAQVRGVFGAGLLVLAAVGYLVLATQTSTAARYVAVWMIVCGIFPFIPILYMWLMSNQAGESKKGVGLVVFGTIGQCGPLLGTRLFPARDKPYYVKGTSVSGGLLLFGAIVAALTSLYLWNINRRRDRQQGALDAAQKEGPDTAASHADTVEKGAEERDRRRIDVLLRGEESPYFRYTI
ncbi:uncharacterized protein PFL1_00338 [Pseudozyma flocculosa PF-1]|uniref:Related to nicotinamide mononucleotide permease n=1 Tax=Pseudozyma flocculosa TaxID=84751 RepID=A0A5C3ESU4_9BASI|nr:uncharacterized protein PFL1_00338 [Pseudozyma flocculosa PF-1]EPQ32141.1 hypothetical protein PFL1_00338 [Pseudozyma flocculosa PF-1]SPO34920.1 related to nicotinamide mononucleotide permease [Pseudozyma flocculosa]